MLRAVGILAAALTLLGAGSAGAATLQPIGEFDEPVYVTSDPGDASRLFVVERKGRIQLVEDGVKTLFANLEAAVGCGGSCTGERGLLSITLSPDFPQSGSLYVDYANDATGVIHVEEMTAAGPDHDTANPATLEPLLEIPHPGKANHNGGQLQFGPEGHLYVSTGDGGGPDDEMRNAQDLDSLLGKILRIDPDPSVLSNFKIPADNPFVGKAGADEIWSYGLRNPFRFSFDKTTGAMLIGDVGQDAREEVNHAQAPLFGAGANYGWSCREGLFPGPAEDPACDGTDASDFVDPVFDYPHLDPGGGAAFGCAIIGGYVAREPTLTELSGRYVYGDLCTGEIRSLDLRAPSGSDRSEKIVVPDLNSFGEDASGRLYAVSGNGPVHRILAAPLTSPPVLALPRTFPFVGLKVVSRPLKRGGRATITVYVSPCLRDRARSTAVVLRVGQRRVGRKNLSRACTASFRPRINRRSKLRAQLLENSAYLGAESKGLTIKPRPLLKAGRGRG
ncbi:MAG: PQQ-dependent sugar dehydrogenase [Solirubrobacterales bacterium]